MVAELRGDTYTYHREQEIESYMSPPPTIRQATDKDIGTLVDLYRRAYGHNEELGFPSSMTSVDEATVEEWLPNRTVFVALIYGNVVGAVHIIPRESWNAPELGRLAVHPDNREQGLGSVLLEFAERFVTNEGWERVRLRTLSDHPFLEEWYRRRRYERVGVERLDDRPYDAPILEKRL